MKILSKEIDRGPFLESPEIFRAHFGRDGVLFVSALIQLLFPLQHMKRPAFQVAVLGMELSSGLLRNGPGFLLERIIVMHTSGVKCIPKIIVPNRNLKIRNWYKVLKRMLQIKWGICNKKRRRKQARLAVKAFKPYPLTEKKIESVFVKQANSHIAIFAQYYIIAIRLLFVNFSWKKSWELTAFSTKQRFFWKV